MELVSVLMCVYNTKKEYLQEAIDSILNQTHRNIEFIIINDCSTLSETNILLDSYADPRIKVIKNEVNLGLTKSLIKGIDCCTARYIARMDSDDIAYVNRIEKQLAYMKKYEFGVIGSYYHFEPYRVYSTFITQNIKKQKQRMIFGNAGIVHSTAFIDKNVLDNKFINYDKNYRRSQDYRLWCSLVEKNVQIGVCPEVLIKWRVSEDQISQKYSREQENCQRDIRREYLKNNYIASQDLINEIVMKCGNDAYLSSVSINQIGNCLKEFTRQNRKKHKILPFEVQRYIFLQCILRMKQKQFDWFFSRVFLRTLLPWNLLYILSSIIFERKTFK